MDISHPSLEFVASAGLAAVLLFSAVGLGSTTLGHLPCPRHSAGLRFSRTRSASVRGLRSLRGRRDRRAAIRPAAALAGRAPGDAVAILRGAGLKRRRLPATRTSLLVAMGDKALFRRDGPAPASHIAYRTSGRFLVARPILFARPGTSPIFWGHRRARIGLIARRCPHQISPALLPVAHDLGFVFFKLGEEAVVDLTAFDPKGNKAKSQRHAINAMDKAGGRFRIVEGEDPRALLPAASSCRTLGSRARGERKGLPRSAGSTTTTLQFPCAVVESEEGTVVAFANVLASRQGGEISVDLMRHAEAS
jgi:lysylphosphatidylglycerol synthetase-like protein (DUF2156 family)